MHPRSPERIVLRSLRHQRLCLPPRRLANCSGKGSRSLDFTRVPWLKIITADGGCLLPARCLLPTCFPRLSLRRPSHPGRLSLGGTDPFSWWRLI